MNYIGYASGDCDFFRVSEWDHAWPHGHRNVRFILDGHPARTNPFLPSARSTNESFRPVVGIILAITAAFVGWFYSPTAAIMIFKMMLGYDAWAGRGIHCDEGAPRN